MLGMQKLPSVDLARVRIPDDVRSIREFTVAELKDELLRRGNVDFSKIELWVKLSPFILFLAMGIAWKIKGSMDGASLWCLL
jgi:hypothetical protein